MKGIMLMALKPAKIPAKSSHLMFNKHMIYILNIKAKIPAKNDEKYTRRTYRPYGAHVASKWQ